MANAYSKRVKDSLNQLRSDLSDHNRAADRLAPLMFTAALAYLVILAALIVVYVDMPRVHDISGQPGVAVEPNLVPLDSFSSQLGNLLLVLLLVVWPVFICEFMLNLFYLVRNRRTLRPVLPLFFCCLCPPLRLALPSIHKDGQVWLPLLGWNEPDKELRKTLERLFSKPMLVIALLILPILVIEFGLHEYVERYTWLRITLHVGTGMIWMAFAIEFITMVSVADKKLDYVRKNWIDLAIVLLPLISFLRSLRVIRAAKLAKFAKMQQLTKMTRIYRMRGLIAKTVRALLLLEVIHRVLRITPQKKLNKLLNQVQEREEELAELRAEIEKLQHQIAITESGGADTVTIQQGGQAAATQPSSPQQKAG